jgi:hypothetical protein
MKRRNSYRDIGRAVRILRENGIEVTESSDGREDVFYQPTICFCGTSSAGYKAVAVAIDHGLKVSGLVRRYRFEGGELGGPEWQMTFWPD